MSDLEENTHKVKVLIGEPKAVAKQRLMDFAARLPLRHNDEYEDIPGTEVTYSELIEKARNYQEDGEYWSEGGRFESQNIYPEFWDDYALVTGKEVTDTWGFFSCSC